MEYSWVLPIYNEAASLLQLFKELTDSMKGRSYEILAVNDASDDDTGRVLTRLRSSLGQLKIITFSTHQGKWPALRAGLEAAKGKVIITLDSDLQDDPRQVTKLLDRLDKGFLIVSGWRARRRDLFYKILISKIGNKLVSLIVGRTFRDINSPFKIYRRDILYELPKDGSLLRYALLFAYRMGIPFAEVQISHRERIYGRSKFGMVKYLRIIYDLILILLLFSGSGRLGNKHI